MPSRVVREGINDSPRMDALIEAEGWMGDSFYRRLLLVADDFGNCDGRISFIRSHCFPTLLEKVREADVSRLLACCEKAGLVRLYSKNGLNFVHINDFRQQVRIKKNKYPPPDAQTPSTLPADESHTPASLISSQTNPIETKARAHSAKVETPEEIARRVVGVPQ